MIPIRFTINSRYWLGLVISLLLSHNAIAATKQSNDLTQATFDQGAFDRCVQQLKHQASSEGVNTQVIKSALDQVSHDPKVIKYDRKQPEFSESFASYFNKRVNQWRIDQGKKQLAKHKTLLLNLQHKYGIPPQYLVSFWGLETNFGNYTGKMSIIRSLVTLACDQRRSRFFTAELMTALKLIEREQLNPQKMLGSWAGAMGHTQFMPSAYMRYAVDGDGDGKINLFDSVEDALTSAANFLHHLGWKTGFRWGREVLVSDDFNYGHSGMDNARSLAQWHKAGVKKTNGQPIDSAQMEAALLVPSGHKGPAFLVYDNFSVIMRWNHSEFYAMAVGRLADRLSGAAKLHRQPPKTANITMDQLLQLQTKLTALGYDVGKPDGIMGPATAKGIRDYQAKEELVADGFPDQNLFTKLGISLNP